MNGGPAEAGQAHSEGWNHSLARSWFRRRPGATALSVLGVVVLAAVALVCSTGTGDGSGESTIGAGVKPPPCAGPATRELVEPERGSAFSFRMPECFRSAAGLVSATARGDGGSGVLLVPLDIPLVPGEPVIGQIRVSAADVGIDASEHSDEEVTEQLRRGLGVSSGRADLTMVRRAVDGARGWGFHLDSPHRPVVVWAFLKGTMQIDVVCRWFGDDLEPRMLAGCNQVVETLAIA